MKLNGIELPIGLRWIDEFSWSPIKQAAEYGLTGAIIVQESAKQNWRPVTLKGGMNFSPITRADLITLTDLIDSTLYDLELTLNDSTTIHVYPVRGDDNPVVASPYPLVLDSGPADPNDAVMYYIDEIKFATYEV